MYKIRKRHRHSILTLAVLAAILIKPVPIFAAQTESKETEATVSFEEGELKLIEVPSQINFGKQPISGETKSYQSQSTPKWKVDVADLRGNEKGWQIQVSLSPFTKSGSTDRTLQGAYITVKGQGVSPKYNDSPATLNIADELKLISNGETVELLKAAQGTGLGAWTIQSSDVKLTVLSSTPTTGQHSAVLTWALQDAP